MVSFGIFVDAANMIHTQREQGWNIDFRKVREYFAQQGEVAIAVYCTPMPVQDQEKLRRYNKYRSMLIASGWKVIDKSPRVFIEQADGQVHVKNDSDVDIVMKMMTTLDVYDHAVLFSGDQDFVPLIIHLVSVGKKVTIVGRQESVAYDLINVATSFVPLAKMRGAIEKILRREEAEPAASPAKTQVDPVATQESV